MRGVLRKLTNTRHKVLARFDRGECITYLKEKVCQHDVFLAIDNVSDTNKAIEQTREYLRASFTQGSVVIVTGRSKKVLTGVGVVEEDCMQMPKLDESKAWDLFVHQVPFVPDEITAEDEAHIESCVKVCRFRNADKTDFDYLPLALKLFGVQLGTHGYDPKLWLEQLPDTSKELMNPVFEILRRSFDALKDDNKFLFMDVVLYFPGECNSIADINIFEWLSMVHQTSVIRVKLRLQELQRKSVIEELDERIGVHELWREFANDESKAGELECRRWVYVSCEFDDVEPSGPRWGKLRRMCFMSSKECMDYGYFWSVNVRMLTKLQYCSNVTVLHLTGLFDGVLVLDVTALKCLKSLLLDNVRSHFGEPQVFYRDEEGRERRVYSRFKLCGLRTLKSLGLLVWTDFYISAACMEDIEHLTSLEFLSLKCKHGDQLPDLSNLKLLQVVQFNTGGRISKISGLNKLTKLQRLSLRFGSECTICACYGIGNLTALEELEIVGRVEVEEVFNLSNLVNLQRLSMLECESIKEIPGLDNLVALKYFCLNRRFEWDRGVLGALRSLPRISKLTNLQILDISYQSITALEGLSDAVSVQDLNASHCYELCELPCMAKLTNLQKLDISWCSVQAIPGLGELVALQMLRAQHCSELRELPDMAKLTNLWKLDISWSCVRAIPGLGELVALQYLLAQHCSELSEIPDLQKLSKLSTLDLGWCALKSVRGLDKLKRLQWLLFEHCSELAALPRLCELLVLRVLDVRGCREQWATDSVGFSHCS